MPDLQEYRGPQRWTGFGVALTLGLGLPFSLICGIAYGILAAPAFAWLDQGYYEILLGFYAIFLVLFGYAFLAGLGFLVRLGGTLHSGILLGSGILFGLTAFYGCLFGWVFRLSGYEYLVIFPWSQLRLVHYFAQDLPWKLLPGSADWTVPAFVVYLVFLAEFLACMAIAWTAATDQDATTRCDRCFEELSDLPVYQLRIPSDSSEIGRHLVHGDLKPLLDTLSPESATEQELDWGMRLTTFGCLECLRTFLVTISFFDWRVQNIQNFVLCGRKKISPGKLVELFRRIDPAEAQDLEEGLGAFPETHWIGVDAPTEFQAIGDRDDLDPSTFEGHSDSEDCAECRIVVSTLLAPG